VFCRNVRRQSVSLTGEFNPRSALQINERDQNIVSGIELKDWARHKRDYLPDTPIVNNGRQCGLSPLTEPPESPRIPPEHIVGRFLEGRPARGRASGIATILLAAPMIASGYLLQVTTDEAVRLGLVVAHVSSGLLFAILLVGHILAAPGRRGPRLDWRGERGIESGPRSESREPFAGPGGRPK